MSPFVKVCDFFNDYFYVEWLCQTSLTLFNSRPTAVNTTWQMSQLQLYAVLCKVFKSIDTLPTNTLVFQVTHYYVTQVIV